MKPVKAIIKMFENRGKQEARLHLLAVSDEQLIKCGISPTLLKQGISAWPWRLVDVNNSVTGISPMELSTSATSKLSDSAYALRKNAA